MNILEELDLAEQRLEKAVQNVIIVLDNARREIRNVRLSRKEVARLRVITR